jgi:light-harvesting complex 1 beta chain
MPEDNPSSLSMIVPREAKGFHGVFIASFAVFLVIALVAQLLTLEWRPWFPGAEGEKSLIGGVRAAVYTLMSHLA